MASTGRSKNKISFKKADTIGPLHTTGPIALSADGTKLVTCVAEEALMTEVSTGRRLCHFTGDTEPITALCLTPSSSHLLLFTSSMSLRSYAFTDIPALSDSDVQPVRVIARAHDAHVHVCKADPTSTYLASGSADGVVKVWDIVRGYVTHVFKGHGGVVSALTFSFPSLVDPQALGVREMKMHLITASVDTKIRVFDLLKVVDKEKGKAGSGLKPDTVLEGHVSVPRGLDVSPDGRWLVSGGRDSVVLIWDLSPEKSISKRKEKNHGLSPTLVNTVPILERVEAVGLLSADEDLGKAFSSRGTKADLVFYTAGQKGVVKVWDGRAGKILFTLGLEGTVDSEEQEEQRQILDAIYVPTASIIVTLHADQNILFHSIKSRLLSRQLIGFNDEIVDACFVASSASDEKDTHLALATNSSLIRLYDLTTHDARLLEGHTDTVLSLCASANGRVLVSSGKDRSARLWIPKKTESGEQWGWACIAVCEGHSESVGAVALSRREETDQSASGGLGFLFTGSQDRTIKMWDLAELALTDGSFADREEAVKCRSLTTLKAHDKDINALDVSPNDRLLASGSQDRTAKVYSVSYSRGRGELALLGVCKGHKRGVWSVKFSRKEKVLVTGSGDKTVRMWSLEDWSCVRTFEGHTNSVLRVNFLENPNGTGAGQIVSAGSDGLLKVWAVTGASGVEECLTTLDGHEDKIWALAVSSDARRLVSGAADSNIVVWEECAAEEEARLEREREAAVEREQDFLNYVHLNDYRRAIELALSLAQPGRLLSLFTSLSSSSPDSLTGEKSVDEVIRLMPLPQLAQLLIYIRDWNARPGRGGSWIVAQRVLHAVVKLRDASDIIAAFSPAQAVEGEGRTVKTPGGVKEILEALVPYTERQLARVDRLLKESYVVDYVLAEMDDGLATDLDGFDEDTEGAAMEVE